ncbi:MAG: DNRLRE domain-containing protein [Candidatus Krumholzibacteria bacterium]|nr:DNRLRE domain-containing protein [Candidatus Krumholzibacteria bacterium]
MFARLPKWRQTALIVLVIASLVGAYSSATADSITIAAQVDATIYSEDGTAANGAGDLWAGRTNGNLGTLVRRALVKFEVEGAIPAEATVDSVRLTLTLVKANGFSPTSTFVIHRVEEDWSEGPTTTLGGRGGAAQIGDVTWSHRIYNSSVWAVPGGDIDGSTDASRSISSTAGPAVFSSAEMKVTVQNWLDGVKSNDGWLLKVQDENTLQTARQFASRDAATGSPSLEIWFTPKVPVEATSWGGVKSRYAQ